MGLCLEFDDLYYPLRLGKPVGSGDKFLRLAERFYSLVAIKLAIVNLL